MDFDGEENLGDEYMTIIREPESFKTAIEVLNFYVDSRIAGMDEKQKEVIFKIARYVFGQTKKSKERNFHSWVIEAEMKMRRYSQ